MNTFNDIPLGFVECFIMDLHNHKAKRVFIDERLKDNKYVKVANTLKLYDELVKHENSLKIYKSQYENLYLDIEKREVISKITSCLSGCLTLISDMNKDLSPFRWDRIEHNGVLCLILAKSDNDYLSEEFIKYEIVKENK